MRMSEFKSDPKKEVEGVIYEFDKTSYIRVARANNKGFLAQIRRESKALRRRYRKNIPDDMVESVVKKAFARHILLEIHGFTDDVGEIVGEGQEIEDSYENRLKIANSESYKDFVDFVSDISTDPDMYKEDSDDELGKLSKTSSGSSPGEPKRIGSIDHK